MVLKLKNQSLKTCTKALLVILLGFMLLTGIHGLTVYGQMSQPYVFITPTAFVAEQGGEVFDMNVDISNVENLRGAEFMVVYDSSLLEVNQVKQGVFFPSPPKTSFTAELNQTLGVVKIGISLTGSEAPRVGSGTLATITFTVLEQSATCAVSVVQLQRILLLDSRSNPISFDSVSALYFWRTPQPDPPVEGRVLDVYTQRGGQGMDVPGGIFGLGEEVQLISRVTYNGDPVQSKLVAYEVLDPLNHTVMIRTAVTNTIGMSAVIFRIPFLPESIGNWTVISIVDIVEKSVWDTLTFEVKISVPVGGYSVAYERGTDAVPEVPYIAVAVAAGLILMGMKTRRLRRE